MFTCESDFVVDIEWFQDDNLVSQYATYESSASFVLDPVSTDHEGIAYLCRVDNTNEILERNITLSVEGQLTNPSKTHIETNDLPIVLFFFYSSRAVGYH